jgi:hypothetical protein
MVVSPRGGAPAIIRHRPRKTPHMTTTDQTAGSCTLCGAVKPDSHALQDHVLNVHPDEFCGLYHGQPCQHGRRERYMAALLDADVYARLERRDDRARFADAVMAIADAEIAAALRTAADLIDSDSTISAAVHATAGLRRIADRAQYAGPSEKAAGLAPAALASAPGVGRTTGSEESR